MQTISGLKILYITSIIIAIFQQPFGQLPIAANSPCNVALAKDITFKLKTDKQQYAFINIIDNEIFNELKRDVNLIAHIPIVKCLVDVSANYSDFCTNRSSFFQKTN